jgi:hypothetical protein
MSFGNLLRSVAVLLAAAVVGCAHQPPPNAETSASASATVPKGGQPHLAAGCLSVCQEATYIELSPKGDLCRCWAPNAFQYTFAFPDTKDKIDYSRARWSSGMQNVRRCQAQGKAWEPSQDREQIVCLDPSAAQGQPDRSAEDHSAPKLPESVF